VEQLGFDSLYKDSPHKCKVESCGRGILADTDICYLHLAAMLAGAVIKEDNRYVFTYKKGKRK
jgi:hypothetical protein